jgi:hypothetical protein
MATAASGAPKLAVSECGLPDTSFEVDVELTRAIGAGLAATPGETSNSDRENVR